MAGGEAISSRGWKWAVLHHQLAEVRLRRNHDRLIFKQEDYDEVLEVGELRRFDKCMVELRSGLELEEYTLLVAECSRP